MKNLIKNNIGVMQGRLLPKYKNRFQAFPVNTWAKEFKIAQKFNIKNIEFIFDYNLYNKNPLYTSFGIKKIKNFVKTTGVSVKSICADYFMESPIFLSGNYFLVNKIIIKKLIKNAFILGVTDIVIPCVDNSSLNNKEKKSRATIFLNSLALYLKKYNVNIALETDLNPRDFLVFVGNLQSDRIKINYDIGNSASLGFDLLEEIKAYSHLISNIHIKDRYLKGGSCLIGDGAINLDLFFNYINKVPRNYLLIMQCYRDEEGVKLFKQQLNYVKRVLNDKRYR
ncbi:sugar phosphate isomerase/epimerase [Alphaproteobacteria bacterium]|nr:sugar phosphate isomerase/epimerase [Alphaproteobacteria bacterium]